MSDLRAELTESIDQAEWEWLMPHSERDAVIVVAPQLDLVDVGMAIVNDQTHFVQRWIAESLIYKPSPQQKSDWDLDQTKRFKALIVQPYVLIQDEG
ncbi:MAG: DUF2288 domain-containing protein [Leptolyngbyaceae cyanobacterium CSU_1_3]|nr:DUF2288 domain-containing protein [Leptolyngbyaceae cyanobacterium CSU_1_3]